MTRPLVGYLNVFNYAVVPQLSLCAVSCSGESIRSHVEERAITAICDIERSDGDYSQSVILSQTAPPGTYSDSGRGGKECPLRVYY